MAEHDIYFSKQNTTQQYSPSSVKLSVEKSVRGNGNELISWVINSTSLLSPNPFHRLTEPHLGSESLTPLFLSEGHSRFLIL